ncbi:hypothetical protein [Glycomyces niveus]|uniref:PPE family domain-containing protein n=1 Tax=Glycomyces niveus TaxID=2820287 RepID=A0ABS3U2X7_9ACTN|nr:hypothetical protein [Glycomyces sp. NEAU-S30]MBO3733123.1 hypothetical protein [Glycomyces sp. NEAU-S30]
MAEPLGFAHYRDSYTDEQLWDMLVSQGNPQSVNLSTSIWRTARGSTAGVREALDAHLAELAEYWRGPASEEFQHRMRLVIQYSSAAEARMALAESEYLPGLAGKLAAAQSRAKGDNTLGESLDPATDITDAEVWMEEVKGLSREQIAALDPQTRTTYNNQHAAWRQARHDELAQTVADLGAQYADYTNGVFAEPAEPAPDGMPGNSTYQQPTTGVFAPTTVDSSSAPTGSSTNSSTLQPEAPVIGSNDDDDVADPWELPSYTDIDEPNGGLASGGTAPTAPVGGAGPIGGTPGTSGGTLPAGGGSLFGPGRPSSGTGGLPGRGTGSTLGRGPATTGPTRGSQPATPGRGGQPGTPGRGTSGRGGQPGTPTRGSTAGRGGQPGTPGRGTAGRTGTTGRGNPPGTPGRTGNTGRNSQPGAPGRGASGSNNGATSRGSGTRAGTSSGVGKNGSPGANSKRRNGESEDEETQAREAKYVQAEDIFTAPFDPAVGPAHEGAKHQRAWNKEYDAWKRRQEEDGGKDRA